MPRCEGKQYIPTRPIYTIRMNIGFPQMTGSTDLGWRPAKVLRVDPDSWMSSRISDAAPPKSILDQMAATIW